MEPEDGLSMEGMVVCGGGGQVRFTVTHCEDWDEAGTAAASGKIKASPR